MSKGTVFREPQFRVPYIEMSSYNFYRVGLIPHFTYLSGDVDAYGALDRAAHEISCVDRVERGPQKINQTRAF